MASSTVLRAVLAFVLLGLALGLLSRDFISLEPAVPNGGAAPQLLLSQDVVIQANVNQTQPPSSVVSSVNNTLPPQSAAFTSINASAASSQHAASLPTRVLCLVVKNEARFIREWIAFHTLAAGFNKVIVFDDSSSDDLLSVLATVPASLVRYVNASWPRKMHSRHVAVNLQNMAISMCLDEFWDTAQVRLLYIYAPNAAATPLTRCARKVLAFVDVDEFVFPCRDTWNSSSIEATWDNVVASGLAAVDKQRPVLHNCPKELRRKGGRPFSFRFPCLRFGLNGHAVTPNGSVVASYTRRASYTRLDDSYVPTYFRYASDGGRPLTPKERLDLIYGSVRLFLWWGRGRHARTGG